LDDDEDATGEENDSAASPVTPTLQLPSPNASSNNGQQCRSLEALLATKNKKILDELAKFRILHGELETALRAAEEKLVQAEAEVRRQRELNEKLENDLLAVDNHWNGDTNYIGDATAPESQNAAKSEDGLAGIELGKKAPVREHTDSFHVYISHGMI
jgi:homeobox protein cut-like